LFGYSFAYQSSRFAGNPYYAAKKKHPERCFIGYANFNFFFSISFLLAATVSFVVATTTAA